MGQGLGLRQAKCLSLSNQHKKKKIKRFKEQQVD